MPESSLALLIVVIGLSLAFAFTNGLNDAANAIATAVGTKVMSPRAAVSMAAVFNFLGAATGTAVAATIGRGILHVEDVTTLVLMAALGAIIIWGLFCTRFGLPISLTHGLVAGIVGAGLYTVGIAGIQFSVLGTIMSAIVIAPTLGFAAAFIFMVLLIWSFREPSPASMRGTFGYLQVVSSAFMSYSHGKNDGQMPIGVITAALVFHYNDPALWDNIPFWVIAISAGSISLGTALGGRRVMRTLGGRITTLRPVHGFAAQSSAAAVIETASQFGIPVSTTHSISAAIMGVGSTKRLSAVRWGVAGNMVAAWIITFPACITLGYVLAWTFHFFV